MAKDKQNPNDNRDQSDDSETSSDEVSQAVAFGPTVLEQLLLAIIDAHPPLVAVESRQTRLNIAMKALTGAKSSASPFKNDRLDKALLFMATERYKDECELNWHLLKTRNESPTPKPPVVRSDLKLAELAARESLNDADSNTIHANTNKLRDMFSGRYWQKGGKRTDIDFKKTYRFRVAEHDHAQEQKELNGLKRLCEELAHWGISTKTHNNTK